VAEALESADHGYVLEAGRRRARRQQPDFAGDDRVRKAYLGMNKPSINERNRRTRMSQERVASSIIENVCDAANVLSGAAAIGLSTVARAQTAGRGQVGLISPISGIYTRPGQVMPHGAEWASSTSMRRAASVARPAPSSNLVVIDARHHGKRPRTRRSRMVGPGDRSRLRRPAHI